MARTLVVLGSGTSMGVPMLGCDCAVCTSDNPRNRRYRPSVLLQVPGGNILVDTTPELRLQLLRERIKLVHAVLYTHFHADHLFGLDDIRLFPKKLGTALPVFCHPDTERVIHETFPYAFRPVPNDPAYIVPDMQIRTLDGSPFEVLGETIRPIPLVHGKFHVFGFRIGNLAYCTDVSEIPEASWPLLEGLDTLLLDCLRPTERHPSHFGLVEAMAVVKRVKPKKTYFTHLSHAWDDGDRSLLPPNVHLAYDGLRIDC